MNLKTIRLWDLPTRLFHWLLLVLVVAAYVTAELGGAFIEWHGHVGVATVGLLTFRIVWGFIGSTYARFTHFIPGPGRLMAYLRGQWQGIGHNPLGALSVMGFLGLVGFQAVSGLFSNDDIAFSGPLRSLVTSETSAWLSGLHRQNYWIIIGLVALHVFAVLFHTHVKKDNLVKPMITGVKAVPAAQAQSAQGGGLVAFVIAVVITAGVLWLATGSFIAPPPPPPVPAW